MGLRSGIVSAVRLRYPFMSVGKSYLVEKGHDRVSLGRTDLMGFPA